MTVVRGKLKCCLAESLEMDSIHLLFKPEDMFVLRKTLIYPVCHLFFINFYLENRPEELVGHCAVDMLS